ncbi:MAG: cation:proton antiporter [Candidatus Taylorbacteria bacterium]
MDIFIELSLIIVIASLLSIMMKILRQPLVVGYILTGILTGPYFFGILKDVSHVEVFSKIGIATLLFIVGLSLSPRVIKEVGKISVISGVGQVIFTSIVGFVIVLALGFTALPAFYIAVALTFSSTIIVLKLLSDKGELDKLYGKISIGFLIVQDVIASLLLISISVVSESGANAGTLIPLMALKIVAVTIFLYLVSKYVISSLSVFFASSTELLFLFSIAWGLGVSSLFFVLGFSMEIGALIAGVVLSLTPFSYEIAARLKPLRDFFIVLFFILLGAQMVFVDLRAIFLPAIMISVFVLVGKPLIMIVLMNLLGYKRRTAFMTGVVIAQISEFSIILIALGAQLGHLSPDVVALVTLVGLITIAVSSYVILSANSIYPKVEWILRFLEFRDNKKDSLIQDHAYEMALFGYDRVGHEFVRAFRELGKNFVVIDFNPKSIERLRAKNIDSIYGDADDVEFLEGLSLSKFKLIVSTIPEFRTNRILVFTVRKNNPHAIILVISHNVDDTKELYALGATYVVMPHHLGAYHASKLISKYGLELDRFKEERVRHLASLSKDTGKY